MIILFTDLDGTLLDHESYSFSSALKALQLVKQRNIPVIFCTSKTMKESCYWRDKLGNDHPFIVENGGGIYIPKHYFSFPFKYNKINGLYYIIHLGAPFSLLKSTMDELENRFDISSFLTMTVESIMRVTNLSRDQAKLASQREFDIPFIMNDETQLPEIARTIKKQQLFLTKGGRFYHLTGDTDKGKAVTRLSELFQKQYGSLVSIGIGDSENDLAMLRQVSKPYLVKRPDGSYVSNLFHHANGIGPVGWQDMIEKEFGSN